MRRIKKSAFFIVIAFIAVFTVLTFVGFSVQYGDITTTYIKGVKDIRWGIDIQGGVDVTFTAPEGIDATEDQMNAAKAVIEQRLINLNITDNELYVDYDKGRIILRFPWQAGEEKFDPEAAVKEIGETALLTFREGYKVDDLGLPKDETKENIILEGKDVNKAEAVFYTDETGQYVFSVSLKLTSEGKEKFKEATTKLYSDVASERGVISIWMDDNCISYPTVSAIITDGVANITGNFTLEEAQDLANKINAGALPFKLETSNFNTISPTLGLGARDSMILAGIIAFVLIAVYMIFIYKLPGLVASIALFGQVIGTIAAISGFFGFVPSFTLTIPGIAGIILAIGMGVDANVVTFERIKEELGKGKPLFKAIDNGYKRAWSAVFDGNITVVFVAIILMGAFGPTDSLLAKLLKFVFFMFGPSTAGNIYSLGYTLLVGIIMNFVFGIFFTRVMLVSLSKFNALKNPKLYGGAKNE